MRRVERFFPAAPIAVVVAILAWRTLREVFSQVGEPCGTLDDSFIHFQYARSFWEGRGFGFSPGSPPVAGATSLLWPLLLAVPYGLGLRAERIVWAAWALGWVALGLLGHETRQASKKLLSPDGRSEERRVGKECRSRWSPYH